MALSPTVLGKLAQYDTATVCNVIELFEVRPDAAGFMDGRIQAAFPELPPMVGFAATAAFRSAEPPRGDNAYGTLETQLELMATLPGPAIAVFQDLDDPAVGATFGEIMCSTYRAFGSAGLITSGGGRDLAQVRAMDFPVFIGSKICSHAHCQILDVGRSVRVGGLTVHVGDLLHGDANGVAKIPVEIAEEAADAAADFVAAEKLILDYTLDSGPKSIREFADRRRACGEALAALRRRVSRKPRG
jgi:regulator of RNase E activity RraA